MAEASLLEYDPGLHSVHVLLEIAPAAELDFPAAQAMQVFEDVADSFC